MADGSLDRFRWYILHERRMVAPVFPRLAGCVRFSLGADAISKEMTTG